MTILWPKQKTRGEAGFPFANLSAERANSFGVAVPAQELVQPARIRFKRQLRDRGAALGAGPVSFVHLTLETALILIKSHFFFSYSSL
jgi:hypothetical protein